MSLNKLLYKNLKIVYFKKTNKPGQVQIFTLNYVN